MESHTRNGPKFKIEPHEVRGSADGPSPTICEVFRRVWRIADHIEGDDPVSAGRLKNEAEAGYDMGKRMAAALTKYKAGKTPGPEYDVDSE